MGRIRIKKKGAVLPFRQTVAYRFILVAAAALVLLVAAFQFVFSFQAPGVTSTLVWGLILLAGGIGLLYNLAHIRDAKIPRSTLERMKRR